MIVAILILTWLALLAATKADAPQQTIQIMSALCALALLVQAGVEWGEHRERMRQLDTEPPPGDDQDTEPGAGFVPGATITAADRDAHMDRVPVSAPHAEHTLHRRWGVRPDQQLPPAHPGEAPKVQRPDRPNQTPESPPPAKGWQGNEPKPRIEPGAITRPIRDDPQA